jgi:hypothetical protein
MKMKQKKWRAQYHKIFILTFIKNCIFICQRIFYDVFNDSRQWPMSRGRACTPLRRAAMR